MGTNPILLTLIYDTIDEVNLQQSRDKKIPKSPESMLMGDGGMLDSLGVVTFIVILERKLHHVFKKNVVLTNDAVLTDPQSIFASVSTLLCFLEGLVPAALP
jgi:hypothetical protein